MKEPSWYAAVIFDYNSQAGTYVYKSAWVMVVRTSADAVIKVLEARNRALDPTISVVAVEPYCSRPHEGTCVQPSQFVTGDDS